MQLNAVYPEGVRNPDDLLARYSTLTGWARALQGAGAAVTVVQRFAVDADVSRDAVRYLFRCDDGPAFPRSDWSDDGLVEAVTACGPQLVHVNGLMFPRLVSDLRAALPSSAAIILQDHAGCDPPRAFIGLRGLRERRVWRAGFEAIDACSFTSAEQAGPWIAGGYLEPRHVLALVESSTTIAAQPRDAAREATGVSASPAILWIGRLEPNKDPLTVLGGLESACEKLPAAHAWMVFPPSSLEADVRRRVSGSPTLADRVTLVGAVSHARIGAYLSAADIFVSGSHREGSGYALLEAMACGAVPVVTAIPSFRAIAGDCGFLWTPGDAAGCAAALLHAAASDLRAWRAWIAQRFVRELSWPAIGRRTYAAYSDIVARRAARAAR